MRYTQENFLKAYKIHARKIPPNFLCAFITRSMKSSKPWFSELQNEKGAGMYNCIIYLFYHQVIYIYILLVHSSIKIVLGNYL